jgi:hypothetical protein
MNAPSAVAVYPTERGRESATESAMYGGIGNHAARRTRFGKFPQSAIVRRVPTGDDPQSLLIGLAPEHAAVKVIERATSAPLHRWGAGSQPPDT